MSTSAHPEPGDPAPDVSSERPDGDSPSTPRPAGDEPTATSAPAAPRARRLLVAWTVVLAAAVLAVDQLTKWWAESSLELGDDAIPLVGDLLGLRLLYNPGAALSIATGMTWLLTIVVVAVVVVIVRMVSRIGSRAWAVALGLLLGGALGNLVDRFFREPGFARGHVVDFIDYAGFFVGNVADIAIVGAAVMIAVLSVIGIGLDGTRQGRDAADEKAADEPAAGETR
ncbi:signal peptidase II [Cellulosimicrobium cellulans]|uniref:signal peptidase II n=1 Tax=Cellulosimicrobium cellulans TaxID=1710 RepID=UPI0008489363|nr:signal peptidase II [Cellulosimicrobium cellulans]